VPGSFGTEDGKIKPHCGAALTEGENRRDIPEP
jgi:hypothetical protein